MTCGGIAGVLNSSGTIIEQCENTGTVSTLDSYAYGGGIVGEVRYTAQIENCKNSGEVSVKSSEYTYCGGIVGDINAGNIISCYNTGILPVKQTNLPTTEE